MNSIPKAISDDVFIDSLKASLIRVHGGPVPPCIGAGVSVVPTNVVNHVSVKLVAQTESLETMAAPTIVNNVVDEFDARCGRRKSPRAVKPSIGVRVRHLDVLGWSGIRRRQSRMPPSRHGSLACPDRVEL